MIFERTPMYSLPAPYSIYFRMAVHRPPIGFDSRESPCDAVRQFSTTHLEYHPNEVLGFQDPVV